MTNLVTSRMNDCHMGSGMNHERMSGDNMWIGNISKNENHLYTKLLELNMCSLENTVCTY
jgi:hypothetical protein